VYKEEDIYNGMRKYNKKSESLYVYYTQEGILVTKVYFQ